MRQGHHFVFVSAIAICLSWLLAVPSTSSAQAAGEVTVLKMNPASPATLAPGEKVEVDFRYDVRAETSFRIFVRPMTGDAVSEKYAASASPLYEPGQGDGRADFSLRSPGQVDKLRIFAVAEDSGRHLARSHVDVSYRFAAPGEASVSAVHRIQMAEVQAGGRVEAPASGLVKKEELMEIYENLPKETREELGNYRPPVWRPLPLATPPEPPPTDDGIPVCQDKPEQCEEVAGRRVTEEGVVIVDCADGSTWRSTQKGDIYTSPEGRSCRVMMMMAMSGTALPPADPPAGVSAAQWAEKLDAWLNHSVANHLRTRIQALLGEPHFTNYQNLESEATHNLYQRIDYRLAFLDKLMEGR